MTDAALVADAQRGAARFVELAAQPAPDPELAARARRQRLMREAGLSDRQASVLRGMSHGLHNSELARDLGMTEHSVKHDAKVLFRVLGVQGRAHAVAEAFRRGWLT